jgi:NAD dependent epimerase/dehydratase family enzyme
MPTAIVAGATGIIGREIVAALGRDSKWTKIHALSRNQKDKYPPSVQHDTVNLMSSAQEIASQLKDQKVNGEYLFFAAYMAKDNEKEASDVNGRSSFQSKNECEPNGISRCDAEELP